MTSVCPGGGAWPVGLPLRLTCAVLLRDHVAAIAVSGELDLASVARFRDVITSVLDIHGISALEVDASGVRFVDSMGLRSILLSRADAMIAGASWRLVAASPALDRLLDLAGAGGLLAVPDAN
ncbi:MAG: STAS domain-containing protein [Ilumatobacteraceae bacterium]